MSTCPGPLIEPNSLRNYIWPIALLSLFVLWLEFLGNVQTKIDEMYSVIGWLHKELAFIHMMIFHYLYLIMLHLHLFSLTSLRIIMCTSLRVVGNHRARHLPAVQRKKFVLLLLQSSLDCVGWRQRLINSIYFCQHSSAHFPAYFLSI